MAVNRPLRRQQLVVPFGVGAIVDFPRDESLLIAGLDAWPKARESCPPHWRITEERLQERLGVTHLRWPPEFREGEGVTLPAQKVPALRFPRWHYCPRCGAMELLGLFAERRRCQGRAFDKGMSCHTLLETRRPWLIPLRFVTVCQHGHLDDFPLLEWVHRETHAPRENCRLRFESAKSASSVFGMRMQCTCGASSTLARIFDKGALDDLKTCAGARLWLGEEKAAKECGAELHVAEKGSSNVYYARLMSSLYLPHWEASLEARIVEVMDAKWESLQKAHAKGTLDSVLEFLADDNDLDADALRDAIVKRLQRPQKGASSGDPWLEEENYRRDEYEVLCTQSGGDNQDFLLRHQPVGDYPANYAHWFSHLGCAHKLRETRALVGFSRWLPEETRPPQEHKRELARRDDLGWLPAIVVRGEGLFFGFDGDNLRRWEQRPAVQARANILLGHYENSRARRERVPRDLNARFILLHTFAHLLIHALGRVCGYSASSLRERLYCNCAARSSAMNGVLIYTASGDSEGSMGGLVRQGQAGRLEPIVHSALHSARWCSADPVCSHSSGQGTDNCNLAACHCCALLPETSCEEFNLLLDRALVVGTPQNPELGFFTL